MRILNLLGVEIGNKLLPPAKDNPLGFWEHREFVALNDGIMRHFQSSWDDVWGLPPRWFARSDLAPFRRRLSAIIRSDFANVSLWAAKDPRLCKLLPFWLNELESLEIEPSCIFILRDPAEVALSLQDRDQFPREKTLLLWLRYVLEAERNSRGCPRVIIRFGDLLSDWKGTVAAISRRFDLTWPILPSVAERDVAAFLSPRHRHHKAPEGMARRGGLVHELINTAHVALENLADHEDPAAQKSLDEVAGKVDEVFSFFRQVANDDFKHRLAAAHPTRIFLSRWKSRLIKLKSQWLPNAAHSRD